MKKSYAIMISIIVVLLLMAPGLAYDPNNSVHCSWDGSIAYSCTDGLQFYTWSEYPVPQEMIDYYASLVPALEQAVPDPDPVLFVVGGTTETYSGQ